MSDEGPGCARITLTGELDIATARRLHDQFAADAARHSAVVILDLSELTFIDSSGLHSILAAHARLDEEGRRLVLVPGNAQVQRIFEITGAEDHFEFIGEPMPAVG